MLKRILNILGGAVILGLFAFMCFASYLFGKAVDAFFISLFL